MAGATNFLEAKILDSLFRTLAAYKPAAIYIGLFTANPTDAGGGTEVSSGNYARQAVSQADAQWNAPSGTPRSISNVNAISWTGVTWSGTVTGWGIFDAANSGNLLMWFDSADIEVASGNTVQFAAGALAISVD